jgi:hypothetical protein
MLAKAGIQSSLVLPHCSIMAIRRILDHPLAFIIVPALRRPGAGDDGR